MKWDALIRSYQDHLATGRAKDPASIKAEIDRLRKLQREATQES